MEFQIVDTGSAYRRLLCTPDATAREAIYQEELIEPFAGLVQFFGGDGLASVHELHHNILGAVRGPDASMVRGTLADYVVGEGLAESFAGEMYGADKIGPWASEFDEAHLERARTAFRDALGVTGFHEIRRYIFGDPAAGLPTNAGYAIGYRVVQAYLDRSGQSAVEATFVPVQTIIDGPHVFD